MFGVVNVEKLHNQQLIVIQSYEGQAVKQFKDQIIRPYESDAQVIAILQELGVDEVWTADYNLGAALLATPGITVEVKHRLDVAETQRAVDRFADALITALDIEVQPPAPALPKWRQYLITKLGGKLK